MDEISLSFEAKTAINIRFEELFEAELRSGRHGHAESVCIAMHGAYGDYLNGRLEPSPVLTRADLEAIRFKPRAN